jgi:RNA polymerase sigma factor (TIGR02999 family)
MTSESPRELSRIVEAVSRNDTAAAARLVTPSVFQEVRGIAHALMQRESAGQTLQPTALANEAYLRLIGGASPANLNDRKHVINSMRVVMKHILVERARRKKAVAHGGGRERVDLDAAEVAAIRIPADEEFTPEQIETLRDALDQLREMNPRQWDVAELKVLMGMTDKQVADYLGIGEATVGRDWRLARAWLHMNVSGEDQDSGGAHDA